MTLKEYIASEIEDIRTRWFPRHVATWQSHTPDLAVLTWAQPGTSNYGVFYVLHRNTVLVHGDLGNASYEWGEYISLKFLAQTELDYFLSKAQGLDGHLKPLSWCSEHAEEWIRASMEEHQIEIPEIDRDTWPLEATSEESWKAYITDLYNSQDVEPETCSMLVRKGYAPNIRAIAHHIGLQLAWQQLKPSQTTANGA